ncbi:DUF7344 domain-containing protein [Halovivax gelatinilyticus]|uniref:DUF7344 domain-containing protein n=1 Tax=Halovivax gelatinilyticus TaxID=2961597 RepID=UPI0020CA7307|nr:hypothetical protein [Halovivax gelatinilyticus]
MAEAELTRAKLFDVFSNARRRMAVRFLTEQNGTCDLTPLVEYVAAEENDVTRDDVTRAQRRRVYISLYQTHLPMLDEHEIIEWEPEAHRIELLMDEHRFEPYLASDLDDDREWYRAYSALSLCGLVGLAVVFVVSGSISTSLAPILAVVLATLFLTLAVVHRLSRDGWR